MKFIKTSSEWIKIYPVRIIDPDGWDRKNFIYSFNEEKITLEEFGSRCGLSTMYMDLELIKKIKEDSEKIKDYCIANDVYSEWDETEDSNHRNYYEWLNEQCEKILKNKRK
jgi:6-pyruvoyl-tetrahydropterin synthase